ncbi:MAG TPA: sigma factor [Verrucomicrobiae bacterium]
MGNEEKEGTQESAAEWVGATHWSWIVSASEQDSPEARAALEKLCQMYWFPLYAYVRRKGHDPAEAQDLAQEFFARILRDGFFAKADPQKGKFRCFLLSSLNHFLANEWRRAHAAKRSARVIVSLDDTAERAYATELTSQLTPEKVYEKRWALSLFDRALDRLRVQFSRGGKAEIYENLKEFLSREPIDGEYGRLAARLQMTNGAIAASVHRLRQRYRELVREEIAQTVGSAHDVEDELRSLLAALN